MCLMKFISVIMCLIFSGIAEASSSIQIITHSENKQQTVSHQGLKAIFSMRWRTWEDGTPIHVFVLSDNNKLHVNFTKKYIGVFPHQLRKAWDRLVFSGTGQAPIQVGSLEEMLNKIHNTPGSIGYITTEKINESVKTIVLE